MTEALTIGMHHVGLAVPVLAAAERFFCRGARRSVVGGFPSYPAAFISDGTIMVTLWWVADPDAAVPFDRRGNVGLHHLALKVRDDAALTKVHERVRPHPGAAMEFAPEPMREGSKVFHFICLMPGGVRIEFATA